MALRRHRESGDSGEIGGGVAAASAAEEMAAWLLENVAAHQCKNSA
jgi:hypothetical protein